MFSIKKLSLAASVLLLVACSSSTNNMIYNWGDGEYSKSLYAYLTQDGDAQEQLKKLEDLAQQSNENQKTPPGLYAQIGLLYNQLGNSAKATEAFNQEMKLFPESQQYMQFLLNKGKTVAPQPETNGKAVKGAKK